ncbi:MAG: hypothetical protein AAF291_10700 [Pseudomonadota bacterium]
MSLLLALTLAAQAEPTDAELLAELERNRIDVTAQQLSNFRGRWDLKDDGTATCKPKRSTGDADLDVLACDAIKACVLVNSDLITRRDARGLPRAERRELNTQTKDAMAQCAGQRFAVLKTEYLARPMEDASASAMATNAEPNL